MRLQKHLAAAGIASRRAAEKIIFSGRVSVNGTVVTEPGTRIDPGEDDVRVDGAVVVLPGARSYLLLNKPAGYVTTLDDPQGRPTVADLVPGSYPRVFPVGRLDLDTTGLLLLTDDGELAHRLMHPRFHVEKTYRAVVDGVPDEGEVRSLETGVVLDDGPTAPARVRVVSSSEGASDVEITIREGRKRQVRRMFSHVGHPVRELRRVAYGPIALGSLEEGCVRPLSADEVAGLLSASDGSRSRS